MEERAEDRYEREWQTPPSVLSLSGRRDLLNPSPRSREKRVEEGVLDPLLSVRGILQPTQAQISRT